MTLLIFFDFAFVDSDAKQLDRILKLVELEWLMIDRCLFPHKHYLAVAKRYLKITAQSSVSLDTKLFKVLTKLMKVASNARELSTVEIEHLKEVFIDNFLLPVRHCRWQRHITWIFLDILFSLGKIGRLQGL